MICYPAQGHVLGDDFIVLKEKTWQAMAPYHHVLGLQNTCFVSWFIMNWCFSYGFIVALVLNIQGTWSKTIPYLQYYNKYLKLHKLDTSEDKMFFQGFF